MIVGPHSMKLPQSRGTESDQLGVPAVLLEKLHRGPCFLARTRRPAFASDHHRQMCLVALDLSIWSWGPCRL